MKASSPIVLLAVLALGASSAFAAKGGKGKPKSDPVEAFLKQNDKNKDGVIERSEAHMGDEAFAKADKNKDGKLDKGELAAHLGVHTKKKK
jgi:Ca2+-binding EF-hand superfamily protein